MQVNLETVNNTVKTVAPIAKAMTEGNSEFAWIDKVTTLLDKVTQFAALYKQNQTEKPADREIDIPVSHPLVLPPEKRESTQLKIVKLILPIIENYVSNCIRENPVMPIGEAIAKLNIMNVTELKSLIDGYKKGNGL